MIKTLDLQPVKCQDLKQGFQTQIAQRFKLGLLK